MGIVANELRILSGWEHCNRSLPYRNMEGRWTFFPRWTERRLVLIGGRKRWQYREREQTYDEWEMHQW